MKKLLAIAALALFIVHASIGIELEHLETAEVGRLEFPVSATASADELLIALGSTVYTVGHGTPSLERNAPIPATHAVIDVARAAGLTAYLTGNVGFSSELKIEADGSSFSSLENIATGVPVGGVIRRVFLTCRREIVLEETLPETDDEPASVQIRIVDLSDQWSQTFASAREMNVLSVSPSGRRMLVDWYDDDLNAQLVIVEDGEIRDALAVYYLSSAAFVSESRIVGVSLDGLIGASIHESGIDIVSIDTQLTNVLTVEYDEPNMVLFAAFISSPGVVSVARYRVSW